MREGDHLPLQMLADNLRVSRAPIMGALRFLERQGVVKLDPKATFSKPAPPGELANGSGEGPQGRQGRVLPHCRRPALPGACRTCLPEQANAAGPKFSLVFLEDSCTSLRRQDCIL